MGSLGEQPEGKVLLDHASRPKTGRRPGGTVEPALLRRSKSARELNTMRRFLLKLFRRRRMHQDLETELAFHREMAGEHRNAIPLGNTAYIKEQSFDLWRFNTL